MWILPKLFLQVVIKRKLNSWDFRTLITLNKRLRFWPVNQLPICDWFQAFVWSFFVWTPFSLYVPLLFFYFNITIFYQVNALNAFQNFKLLLSIRSRLVKARFYNSVTSKNNVTALVTTASRFGKVHFYYLLLFSYFELCLILYNHHKKELPPCKRVKKLPVLRQFQNWRLNAIILCFCNSEW